MTYEYQDLFIHFLDFFLYSEIMAKRKMNEKKRKGKKKAKGKNLAIPSMHPVLLIPTHLKSFT